MEHKTEATLGPREVAPFDRSLAPVLEARAQAAHAGLALRCAVATTLSALFAESMHLEYGFLAVLTAHIVMAQFDHTSFQKGIERIAGRSLGVLCGTLVVGLFQQMPVVALLFEWLILLVFFYVYFSGRLAYTFLQGGLYLAAIAEIGYTHPEALYPAAVEFLSAIVLGVVVALVVNWLTGADRTFAISAAGSPLLPIRGEWISHSLMLVVTVAITLRITRLLELPTGPAVVSVLVLTITNDRRSMIHKGVQRLEGAVLGGAAGFVSLLLLAHLPHLPILLAFCFLWMFLAAYITTASARYSYVGLQMGLVVPMVLVVPRSELVSASPALERIEGVLIGMATSVIVRILWPAGSGKDAHAA